MPQARGLELTIGVTLYEPYPAFDGADSGHPKFDYQNGGDWSWFGGRMVQALAARGLAAEGRAALQPMLERVVAHDGFFEFWDAHGTPHGSGSFRGAAGVLAQAVLMLDAGCEPAGDHGRATARRR